MWCQYRLSGELMRLITVRTNRCGTSIVGDLHVNAPVDIAQSHARASSCACVLSSIGKGLLNQAVDGELRTSWHGKCFPEHNQLNGEPGGANLFQERIELVQSRLRLACTVEAILTQHSKKPPHLGNRLAPGASYLQHGPASLFRRLLPWRVLHRECGSIGEHYHH